MSEEQGEKCVRCGEVGEDRRTLWMACFYDMDELGLPFEQKILFHANPEECEEAQEPFTIPNTSIVIQPGTVTCKGELTPHGLFTLRVCKACRGDWLNAIDAWFHSQPSSQQPSPGTGIFVRDNGTNKEITLEEWEQKYKNR